jgi:hypothetical protein
MADTPKTGLTGTIVLGTTGLAFSFTKIGEWQSTRGKLQASHLATVTMHGYQPDDLAEPGEVEVEGWFEGKDDVNDISNVAETITITYPCTSGGTDGGALSGTGFIILQGLPELVQGQLMKAKFKVAFDGYTGPAYAVEHSHP